MMRAIRKPSDLRALTAKFKSEVGIDLMEVGMCTKNFFEYSASTCR